MTSILPWYPPAPAAGPASLLELPPDDWALEPKIDGIRIVWLGRRVFTRHGSLLSSGKGASRLSQLLHGISDTLDGEWVAARDTFFAFDLPDGNLDYDGRRGALARLLNAGLVSSLDSPALGSGVAPSMATAISGVRLVASYWFGRFPQVYAGLKAQGAEGVVLKRRRSCYAKQMRAGMESRDWLKRRFSWD